MSEPSNITPDMAARVLDANWKNVVKKVAAGRTMNATEIALIKAKAAGSDETVTHVRDLTDLARVLGVTRQTIYGWRKKADAPQPASNGSHDVVAWRDFIAKHDLKAGLSPDAEVLKARKLLAEIEDRELKVAIKKGEYVPLDLVKEEWTSRIGKAISLLRARFENELPPLLVGLNAPEIQTRCAAAIDDVCAALHSGTL
jgi:predicted DNA-binding transcriptional regulator AlpA